MRFKLRWKRKNSKIFILMGMRMMRCLIILKMEMSRVIRISSSARISMEIIIGTIQLRKKSRKRKVRKRSYLLRKKRCPYQVQADRNPSKRSLQ